MIDKQYGDKERLRGGRPWSFDRDEALEIAMTLFWQHGYEGVSIGDLTKAIGIAPPSLYAAFVSKEKLYQSVLDLYEAKAGAYKIEQVRAASGVPEAVAILLDHAAGFVFAHGRGCMISVGMVTFSGAHASIARDLAERREKLRERIATAIAQWVSRDEAERMARMVLSTMQGLSIQALDGATREELQMVVDEVVAGLRARFA